MRLPNLHVDGDLGGMHVSRRSVNIVAVAVEDLAHTPTRRCPHVVCVVPSNSCAPPPIPACRPLEVPPPDPWTGNLV